MYVLLGTKLLWFKMYISFANILWVPICPHTWLLDIQYVSVIIPAVPLFLLCAIFLRVSFNTLIAPSNCVVYSALSSTKITCIVEWVFIGNCSCLTAHSWTNPKLRTGFPLTVNNWLGFAANTPIFATDANILAADARILAVDVCISAIDVRVPAADVHDPLPTYVSLLSMSTCVSAADMRKRLLA